ncbi:MAG TPA: hypothetical protein VHB50_03505 [Bryobacteraceae bacterium]|nr:hypothetical protein [Bryobacteraceae bacterium]
MAAPRYLCSHLVQLNWNGGSMTVNLEEVWREGAVLDAEEAAPEGTTAEIRCGSEFFTGRLIHVTRGDFGWRIEMEFSPLTPWSPERFRPQHLIDLSMLEG